MPTNMNEVRSFLGFCSYYRRFIFSLSEIAKPIHKLTEKGTRFKLTEDCSNAILDLKSKLITAPVLAHPDFSQSLILSIRVVISHKIGREEHAIAFASRTLSKTERRYCVTRKELLPLVTFAKHFKHYMYGKKCFVRTDHSSLKWLMDLLAR